MKRSTPAAASPAMEPIVLVVSPLDLATARRARRLNMRPTRLQKVFLAAVVAALLAFCVHLATTGEGGVAARGVAKFFAMALAVAASLELLTLAAWRMDPGNRMPSLLIADTDGVSCRRYDPEPIPWRDVTWWDESEALLSLRMRTGGFIVVPRKSGNDAGWERLREVVAARVPHADQAESRAWILILVLFAILIASFVYMLSSRTSTGS